MRDRHRFNEMLLLVGIAQVATLLTVHTNHLFLVLGVWLGLGQFEHIIIVNSQLPDTNTKSNTDTNKKAFQ